MNLGSKTTFQCFIAALVVLSSPIFLKADWELLGPYGGHALKIVIDPKDPSHLFVATKNGQVYHSTNRGMRWTPLPFSLNANAALHAIVVHPEDSSVIYLGVAENSAQPSSSGISGVFSSDDGGQTWTLLPATRDWPVLSLAIHPKQPQIIVAGTLQGVYRSDNGGVNWKRISPLNHPDLKGVVSLALDSADPQVVYAGTPHLPWRTLDGGASWTSIHQGMIDDSDMFSITVDRTDSRRIFASACSGIYRSSSRGDLWTKMQGIPGSNRRTHIILQDPVDEKTVYAGTTQGLWKSPDGGSTWRKANPYPYVINSIAIDSTDHNRLYLATDRSGILASHDGGGTFQSLNEGFINRNIRGFVSEDALYLSSLYDGDFGGIFSTVDAGRSWKLNANQVALNGKNVISLAVSPVNPRVLLAGTYEGLLKSEDGGASWRAVTGALPRPANAAKTSRSKSLAVTSGARLPETKIFDVRFSTAAADTVYAATAQGLFESSDSGATWKKTGPVPAAAVYKVILHASDPNLIIAQSSNRVYVSRDRGASWTETRLGDSAVEVNDLAFGGAQGRILAGTSHGLSESLDGGKSWTGTSGVPMIPVSQFCVSKKQPALMYFLSRPENQIYQSTDGGERWTRFDDGGLRGLSIQSMASGTSPLAELFVLTENHGVLIYRPDQASGSGERTVAEVNP